MKVYSKDEENFPHEGIGELFDDVWCDGELVAGRDYWSGDAIKKAPSEYFDCENMIENMRDAAYEAAGEYSDDFMNIPTKKIKELDAIISCWLDAHVTVSFYTVENVQKHCIQVADIEEWMR